VAVGHVATYNGTAATAAGTPAVASGVDASPGETLVAVVGCDDIASVNAIGTSAVTDSSGNTWQRLVVAGNTDATLANASNGAFFGTVIADGKALVNGSVTFTPSATSPVKDLTVYRMTGLSLTVRGSNSGIGSGATPAGLASSAPLSGDFVIGATVLEGPTTDTWTPDSDTTNGSWSTDAQDGTTSGSAAANITIHSQFKIVNATGTQTYNGSNSVTRDWTRMLLVLAPSPAPPASALPPAYVPTSSITISTGIGRVTASLIDCYAIGPDFDPRLPPVVYMAGAGSTADELAGALLPGLQPTVHAIVDAGFAIVCPTTILTYGNATGRAGIDNALAYARNTLGCANTPAVLLGASEGAGESMTYAYLNQSKVACIVGLIPIADLAEMVEQNVLGLAQTILDAWGVGALPLPSDADPMTPAHQALLSQVPMQLWYATDDAVSANITALQAGTGCDIRAVGPLGHTDAAIAAAWPTDIVRFIRKRVGISRGMG
jgi:hypothetical protein